MAKFTHIANSFKAGQLGEKLVGRTDIEEYRNGCLEMKNMISTPTGGAIRRGGLAHLVKPFEGFVLGNRKPISIPVILGAKSFLVCLIREEGSDSARNIEVYSSEGTAISITGFTSGLLPVLPEDCSNLRWAQFGKLLFVCSSEGDTSPLVVRINDLVTPITFDAFNFFGYPQGDINSYPLRLPYSQNLDPEATLTYTRGDPDTIEIVGDLGEVFFFPESVGTRIRLLIASAETEYIVTVTGYVSGTKVEVTSDFSFGTARPPNASSTSDWGFSQWNDVSGWPQCVTVFQNRLVFGTTSQFPTTIWASAVGNPFIFMQQKLFQDQETETTGFGYFGELDDLQAFDFPISSTRSTEVTWLGSQRSLHVGTDTVEYALASDTGLFGALSFPNLRPQTFHGSRNIQPERVGRYSIFIGEDGKTVRDFAYSDQNGSHASRDLSILSPDIIFDNLRGGTFEGTSYIQMAWQESNRTLWAITNRGSLVSFSFDENSDLKAWATHQIGGDPEVVSCCVVPYKGKSTLFIAGILEVDEVKEIQIYRLVAPTQDPKYLGGSSEINYFDLGAAYVYEEATDTHDADWLEGEEVFALADGNKVGPFTVNDGTFTTATEVTEISFGKKYQHKLTTMPLEAGTVIGSAQGQLKRVDRMFLDLYRAEGTKISYGDTSYPIEYPSRPDFTSFTGRVKYDYDSTPDERYLITLEGDDPLPFGILNITFRGVTQD